MMKKSIWKFLGIGMLGIMLSQSAFAFKSHDSLKSHKDVKESQQMLTSSAFQSQLNALLFLEDQIRFNRNLVKFIVGFELDGAKLYGALAEYSDTTPFSGAVVTEDGYYYIAYKGSGSRDVVYITNDGYCTTEPHDIIKVFASSYGADKQGMVNLVMKEAKMVNTNAHDCTKVYGRSGIKKAFHAEVKTAAVESEEQQKLRQVAESIWDPSVVAGWNMNEVMADVIGQAVNAIKEYSANFNSFSNPIRYIPSYGWSYYLNYFLDILNDNKGVKKVWSIKRVSRE